MCDDDLSQIFCSVESIHGLKDIISRDEGTDSIKFGSTLLLSGPPGAGKTTFALATVRAMMANAERLQGERSSGNGELEKCIAYYIGSEIQESRLLTNFQAFGWFTRGHESSDKQGKGFKFLIDDPIPDATNFYCLTPMLEVDRPVPSPEELVNGIFRRIFQTLVSSEATVESAKFYVIIDSITALLKGCEDAGEERRQTHEIIRRLKDRFDSTEKKDLALIVLLAEQDHRSQDAAGTYASSVSTAPSVEDYLADIVFRLYVRSLPLGKRTRMLEVVKSQGATMALGEHTWQIISETNYSVILRHEDFQQKIKKQCLCCIREKDGQAVLREDQASLDSHKKWGGIIIFPRPTLNIINRPDSDTKKEEIKTGTHDLGLTLKPESITLIAGSMGCGKTKLCTQFLLKNNPSRSKCALITLDIRPPRSQADEGNFRRLVFPQSLFDINTLVTHINWLLDDGCKLLALDGFSEWITSFSKPEAARVFEALVATLRRKKDGPAVFMTYEMPLNDDPMEPAALGAAADNIVVVRTVPINDNLRRVLYILKSEGELSPGDGNILPPQYPRELELRGKGESDLELICNPVSLGAFTGLLSPGRNVEPARVLVRLFAENDEERKFNKEFEDEMLRQYGGRLQFTFTEFALSDLGSTLESAFGAGRPSEAFNITLHSVDEWWLRTEESKKRLQVLSLRRTEQLPSYHNFWWFEVEKAMDVDSKKGWRGIPGYIDFGMFCIDLDAMSESSKRDLLGNRGIAPTGPSGEWRRLVWSTLLSKVPRLWAISEGDWFRVPRVRDNTVLGFALELTDQEKRTCVERMPVFIFDLATKETCSCMFFELAWAFGASEAFLNNSKEDSKELAANRAAARKALCFLQFLVMERLMPARGMAESLTGKQHVLFSRRWYSTFCKGNSPSAQGGTRVSVHAGLIALPFMPTGQQGEELRRSLLRDVFVRQQFWWTRAEEYVAGRESTGGRVDLPARKSTSLESVCLGKLLIDYDASRKLLLMLVANNEENRVASDFGEENWTADLDDLLELASWAALRLQLLAGADGGRFPEEIGPGVNEWPGRALHDARVAHYYLPDLSGIDAGNCRTEDVVPTGYVCSGSWMYGVDANSRASEIQGEILTELTSRKNAEKRALTGAGMPARKDFFHLSGDKPVCGMEYLSWRELLRFGGARGRRRDRLLSHGLVADPSPLYNTIHTELLACLRIAELHRPEYENTSETARGQSILAVTQRAILAIDKIFSVAGDNRNG